jgi:TPP-dependent pyruvate/acetoin dehydrogenase alpha subunit
MPDQLVSKNKMSLDEGLLQKAILIRTVENKLLQLFSEGKLNGTVHTCVGQEFSALAFAGQISKEDTIFSNHRCHGHYLSFTDDYEGLLAELMGKKSGVCGGIGGSQHLCKGNFYSNGIQGGCPVLLWQKSSISPCLKRMLNVVNFVSVFLKPKIQGSAWRLWRL